MMMNVRDTSPSRLLTCLAAAVVTAGGCVGSAAGRPDGGRASGGSDGGSAGGAAGSSANPDAGGAETGGNRDGGGPGTNGGSGGFGSGGSNSGGSGGLGGAGGVGGTDRVGGTGGGTSTGGAGGQSASGGASGAGGISGSGGMNVSGGGVGGVVDPHSTGPFVSPPGPLFLDVAAASNPVMPSGRLFYEVTISNVSAQVVNGVSLSLLLPASLQFNGAIDANPDSPCFNNACSANTRANWTIGTLGPGSSQTITINAQVIAAAVTDGDTISSSFTAMATGVSPVTVDKVVQVLARPQAQLTFGTTTNPVTPAGDISYDIDVGQVGTVPLSGTTLRVLLPAGLIVDDISDGGAQAAATPGEIDWNIGTVGVGETLHRSIRVTGNGTARAGSILAARAIMAYAGTDPNPTAEFSVAVVGAPQALTVAWDVAGTPVAPGGRLLHTMTIGNVSTRAVSGLAIVLRLPGTMRFNGAEDALPDANCFNNDCAANTEAVWSLGALEAGASTTVAFNGIVSLSGAPDGTLVSTHLTLAATGVPAFNLVKTAPVFGASQAQLAFSTAANPVLPNGTYTYDLDVGHFGATTLTGTALRAYIPTNLAVVAVSDGGTQTAPGRIDWDLGSLAVGSSVHRTLRVTADGSVAAGGFLQAHVVLTHEGGLQIDGAADYSVAVAPAAQPLLVDLGVASSPGLPAGRLLYTMTISNISLQPVTGVSLTLPVPAGLLFNGAGDAEPNAGCFNNNCAANIEAPWSLGTIAAGASVSIAVNAQVLSPTLRDGNLVPARVTVTAAGLDPSIVARTVAIYGEPRAELAFGTATNPVVAGGTFTYVLDVGQIGATPLTGTTLRVFLPPGVTIGSISDGGTQAGSAEVDWALGTVAVGAALRRTLEVTVSAVLVPGWQLAAHAALTYDGGLEIDAASDETVSVVGSPVALSAILTATPETVRAATRLRYNLAVTNVTARPVDGISVLLRVPANLQFNGVTDASPASGCFNANCATGVESFWNVGTLAAGITQSISVNAQVASTVLGGTLLPATFKVTSTGQATPVLIQTTVPVQ